MSIIRICTGALLVVAGSLPAALQAQSVSKLERKAINRTRITLVNGDTVQRFTTTLRQPKPKPDRMYYWQGQDHILRTVGAYNGHLLDGSYRLTDRTDRLLGAGTLRKGLKTGTWRKWRPDGSLASSNRWSQGRQRGRTINYDANSRPLPAPTTAKPAVVPVANSLEKGSRRWWQPRYWKSKFQRHRTGSKTPPPAAPPASPVPIKERVPTSPPPPDNPKKAGS